MEELNYLWSWECIPRPTGLHCTYSGLMLTPLTTPCYLTISQSELCMSWLHSLGPASHLACENALLKSFGGFEGFEREPPVLLVWHHNNKCCTSLQPMSVDRLYCMWASGPKFDSVTFLQNHLLWFIFFYLSQMISLLQFFVYILSLNASSMRTGIFVLVLWSKISRTVVGTRKFQ